MTVEMKKLAILGDNYTVCSDGEILRKNGKPLSPNKSQTYLQVAPSVNGVSKCYNVHRLIALAFVPNPENKPCINHKDFNKYNNNADNLEWVTYKENTNHYVKGDPYSLIKDHRGEKCYNSKLNVEKVKIVRLLKKEGISEDKIAECFNVSQSVINDVLTKKSWKEVPE